MNQIEQKRTMITLSKQVNDDLCTYGYWLSEEDIQQLRKTQKEAYQANGMIDFDVHIIFDLAKCFANSPYLKIDTFLFCIEQVLYLYYALRKILRNLYDDELVELIYHCYLEQHGVIDSTLYQYCVQKGRAI